MDNHVIYFYIMRQKYVAVYLGAIYLVTLFITPTGS